MARVTMLVQVQFELELDCDEETVNEVAGEALAELWGPCEHFGGPAAELPLLDCDPSLELVEARVVE